MVKEKLLHFVWQNQLIEAGKLKTTAGETISVKERGTHNHDAGPDFKNAQIKIGNELWAGHVEIHVNAKDWLNHGHQHDVNYNNVILHVVLFNDIELNMPTLELNGKIQKQLLNNYNELMKSKSWVPCAQHIKEVDHFAITQLKDRLIVERLERKIDAIKKDLNETKNNWEEAFYRSLMRYGGLKVNKLAFEKLAQLLTYKLILKHRNNQFQVEALLFGVAGFLENENDEEYFKSLRKEFDFLKSKYGLKTLKKSEWLYATLRPANFPTLRLAQFASLFCNKSLSFTSIIEKTDAKSFVNELVGIKASDFWDNHYSFTSKAKTKKVKRMGKTFAQLLVVNHFAPVLYGYGWYKGINAAKEKAIDALLYLKSEENKIITKWNELGIVSNTSFDSQALIELKLSYCDLKKCLNCSVGNKILRKNHV
ncbi:MAG: DUF2851 family protein [Bacteroidia bacterium]